MAIIAASAASAAFAAKEDVLEKAPALVAEARPFVEKASGVEAEMAGREAPRKEEFCRLKDARKGAVPVLRNAATQAIESMGVHAVPYLIAEMQGNSRQFTTPRISRLTGQSFGERDAKLVADWWAANRPKDAE